MMNKIITFVLLIVGLSACNNQPTDLASIKEEINANNIKIMELKNENHKLEKILNDSNESIIKGSILVGIQEIKLEEFTHYIDLSGNVETELEAFISPELNGAIKKLDALNIAYMVTGGSAVGFWGHARTTMDIDMVVSLKVSEVDKLFSEFEKEAYINKEDILSAVSQKKMFNVIFNNTSFKIDFILYQEDDDYEKEKFSRKIEIDFGNLKLSVISPEDLILSKLKWMKIAGGSERQIGDCKSIMLVNKNIDMLYINKWARFLNIEEEVKLLIEK